MWKRRELPVNTFFDYTERETWCVWGALPKHGELPGKRFVALAFEHLEEEGELGHLDGLGIDIHAVDVLQQNALALGGGEPPDTLLRLVQGGRAASGPFLRLVIGVPPGLRVESDRGP